MIEITAAKVWLAVGFAGQCLFGLRFLIQWIATERRRRSVIPVAFWYLSLGGTVILLSYAVYRLDPVFIAGFSLNMIIYVRNLYFIHRRRRAAASARGGSRVPASAPLSSTQGPHSSRRPRPRARSV
jgi:lipid-A-disaccharide synthase-like uncharacterized protein